MEATFQTFHNVLSMAGISIFADRKWDTKPWLVLQNFSFFVGVLTFIFTSGFVVAHSSDLHLCIKGACIWTTGLIMLISFGICLIFRQKIRLFLQEMGFKDLMLDMPLVTYVLSLDHGEKLLELKNVVVTSQDTLLKITRVILKVYVASVWLCATLYLCDPIYQMIVTEDESLRLLAFDMWFPWSMENFKVYIASFIFNAYAGYLCCIAYPGFQCIIILLVGQIIRQLKILTFILLNLDELMTELARGKGDKWQIYCTLVMSQCVDHYVKLKRFANQLNRICRPFYLVLIIDAIMLVCVCSVKIAVSNKLSPDTMKYYVHEFCFILVVLMFCLLGQQVENQCEKLETAVTEKWYIFNQRHKVNMQIFKMALSQRMPIYIFGSITLSLPTFTWFIKTGMSFFTLVMSVLDEQ